MEIFAVAFLIFLNGLFAMSEMALVSSRKARLQKLVDEGDTAAAAALALNNEPTRFLSTIQIGITSVGVLSGIVGEATLAKPLASGFHALGMADEASQWIATGLVVVIITYLSIVFGELVPKRLAQGNPESLARIVAAPITLLALLVGPFVSLLTRTTELVLALFPRKTHEPPSVTEEEIEALLEEGSDAGVIEAQEHQMVRNVFRLDDRQITSLMVPRSEIVALDAALPTEENLSVIAASDHSRFPVLRGDSRDIVGIVSAKHLLNQFLRNESPDIQRAMQAAVFVPETLTGMELLENFRASWVMRS
ncbi:MAG: HlyC/CorC family transporter, partial [Betaproteobacteria bacterium]|nr:HlyC/CorC family transporter [Betaproteobacteria bacterium]